MKGKVLMDLFIDRVLVYDSQETCIDVEKNILVKELFWVEDCQLSHITVLGAHFDSHAAGQ